MSLYTTQNFEIKISKKLRSKKCTFNFFGSDTFDKIWKLYCVSEILNIFLLAMFALKYNYTKIWTCNTLLHLIITKNLICYRKFRHYENIIVFCICVACDYFCEIQYVFFRLFYCIFYLLCLKKYQFDKYKIYQKTLKNMIFYRINGYEYYFLRAFLKEFHEGRWHNNASCPYKHLKKENVLFIGDDELFPISKINKDCVKCENCKKILNI